MKRFLSVIILNFVFSFAVSAQNNADKTTVMEYSLVPNDPICLSMGGVNASGGNVAWSAFQNIASLPFYDGTMAASASWQSWNPSSEAASTRLNVGVSYLVSEKVGIAGGLTMANGKEYVAYDNSGRKTGSYTPNEMNAVLGISYKILDFLSVGAGAKYMNSRLASDYSISAIAFDAMVNAQFGGLAASVGLCSIGGGADGWDLPANLVSSASYNVEFANVHCLNAAAQLNYFLNGGMNLGLGAAYCYNDLVSVRAGYNLGKDGIFPSYASAGAGVKISCISLDAAYIITGTLSGSLSVALTCSF